MRVQDLLEKKGKQVQTISADQFVDAAVDKLTRTNVGALIVVDADRPVGIFAERDVLRGYVRDKAKAFSEIRVRDAMTNKLIVAEPEDDIDTAMATMIQADIRHLPIFKDNRIIGMLTISDLVKNQIGSLKAEVHYLQEYITDLQDASQD